MNALTAYTESKGKINKSWMKTLTAKWLNVEKQTPDNLWHYLEEFKPTQGWIQTLDEILLIQNNFQPTNDIIQTAELVNENKASLHIRPVNNQATVFIYTETQTQGKEYLSTTYQHNIQHKTIGNNTHKASCQASYQVYWDINPQDEDDPRRPIKHSRFIGFTTKQSGAN
ncbi:MAG: hypothetical protein FE834_01285 [Gammaproteobacteria bacterium]|nr:hypothetical protein [Gammaproteobacteria bacterium]